VPYDWGKYPLPVPDGMMTLADVARGALPDGEVRAGFNLLGDGTDELLDDIRDLARTGDLRVWGHDADRCPREGIGDTALELIPKEHWDTNKIGGITFAEGGDGLTETAWEVRKAEGQTEWELWNDWDLRGKFCHLLFRRDEIEATILKKSYPPANQFEVLPGSAG
jgi:hypothetical protein